MDKISGTPDSYVLFTPKNDLLNHLEEAGCDAPELLAGPFLWSQCELDSEAPSSPSIGTDEAIKYIFLISMYQEYVHEQDLCSAPEDIVKFAELAKYLTGYPRFSSDQFEKWWNLHIFSGVDSSVASEYMCLDQDLMAECPMQP